jgi:DNA replication protein DnaC
MEKLNVNEFMANFKPIQKTPEEIEQEKIRQENEIKMQRNRLYHSFYQDFNYFSGDITKKSANDFIESNPQVAKAMHNWNLQLPIGICFVGPVGVGKTHAMTAMLNKAVYDLSMSDRDPKLEIYWNSVSVLVDEMRDLIRLNEISLSDHIKKIQRRRFMFLDDFGAQKTTDFAVEKLVNILDYRVNHELPTFFSTNCAISEIKETLGERMLSRMTKLSGIIEINGKDRRAYQHAQNLKMLLGEK